MQESLQHTALYEAHQKLGARFTDFGGWEMPLKYTNELEEHRAVRTNVGIFDLSHMGEIYLSGPDAAHCLDHALISTLSAVKIGKAKYSMICTSQGTIIDDLITYRTGEQDFLLVPNAGNTRAVLEALTQRAEGCDVTIVDHSHTEAMIAVQGPRAHDVMLKVLEAVTDAHEASGAGQTVEEAIRGLRYYAAFHGVVAGQPGFIARTGYTGEDGFEIIVDNSAAPAVWEAVIAQATQLGGLPCGLASRDTLRLEAGMPLYGNELSLQRTPVDAGLGVLAATSSSQQFVGRDALLEAKQRGSAVQLVGLAGQGRRAARSGYTVHLPGGDQAVGQVTSGALSPTLGYPIALAYVQRDAAAVREGDTFEVDIRGKRYPYTVVSLPFYRREK